MKKDAYYFSHDGNAQDDPKMIFLIEEMGMEGVGIFWCLIEKLRSEKDFTLQISDINAFALRWHTTAEKVLKVIKCYKLFKIEDDLFFSERLKQSMNEKSEKARESANYRWNNANASDRMQTNAIKVKKSKVKKSISNTVSSVKNGKIQPEYGVDNFGKQYRILTDKEREKAEWEFNHPNSGIQPD